MAADIFKVTAVTAAVTTPVTKGSMTGLFTNTVIYPGFSNQLKKILRGYAKKMRLVNIGTPTAFYICHSLDLKGSTHSPGKMLFIAYI